MAVRYSGDAEVRVRWDPRRCVYYGTVRDPRLAWRGTAPALWLADPRASGSYDRAAQKLLERADRWAREHRTRFQVERSGWGDVVLRRVFQSPCPIGEGGRDRGLRYDHGKKHRSSRT